MSSTKARRGRSVGCRTPLETSRRSQRNISRTPSTPTRVEDVLEEGDNYVMKATNSPVPVQVQEILRADAAVAGVRLDESGWAMLVAGSRLLIWRYCSNQLSAKCVDVALPASSVGWNVNMLTFTSGLSDSRVSVMGCSGEGDLCWWYDVLQSASIRLQGSVEVGGGCVFSINHLRGLQNPDSCLVTTSLASMCIIRPDASETSLWVESLAVPQSVFSGLGRRVSSIFFRSQTAELEETRRVLAHQTDQGDAMVLLLTRTNIQRWNVSQGSDQLVIDTGLLGQLKDEVLVHGWMDPASEPSVHVTDMQITMGHLALLFAVAEGSSAELGIAVFPLYSDFSPSDLKRLIRLRHSVSAGGSSVYAGFALHAIEESPALLMISKSAILLTDVLDESFENQVIPFSQSNMLVGVGQLSKRLLIFSRGHGVVTISQTTPSRAKTRKKRAASSSRLQEDKSFSLQPSFHNKPTASLVTNEATAEASELLNTAFFKYLDGNLAEALSICEDRFLLPSFSHGGINTLGDMAVVQYSQLILDDLPPQVDTLEGLTSSSSGQTSMIIIYRLQQKAEAHSKYLRFLMEVGLLERLTSVWHSGTVTPTKLVLCEHAELLQAAISLKKLHDQFVDGVINLVVRSRPGLPAMSRNDVFYTSISCFKEFFPALIQHQREIMAAVERPHEKVKCLLSGSTLLDSMLRHVLFYRQSMASSSDNCLDVSSEHCPPWTTSAGSTGIRTTITDQLDMVVDIGVAAAQDQELHALWNNAASLMDILFDGYKTQMEMMKARDKVGEVEINFSSQKTKYLTLLMKQGQLHYASELAERYHDFRVLVSLCQGSGNNAKLKEYIFNYSEQGFSAFLFKMYLDEGNLQQLLSFSKDFPSELNVFLETHPYLSWLHHLATQEYSEAYKTLKELALQETKHVMRKKTLLSLSKLSLLASRPTGTNEAEEDHLNTLLHHIQVQEDIPSDVVGAAEVTSELMPPLSPKEIVEKYIGEQNPGSSDEQFLQVLDYISFCSKSVDASALGALYTYIWSQALLKDDWSGMSLEDPLEELQKTFFFRIVDKMFHRGVDVCDVLPDLSSLLQQPAIVEAGLPGDHTFTYLMKAGYELISRVYT